MNSGQILVAERDGVNVIKMLGDVRLVLCISFDNFIASMFNSKGFRAVVFDLRNASAIDSTTLGLMAKISIKARELGYPMPIVITLNSGILRLLESMGFDDIFELVGDDGLPAAIQDTLPIAGGEPLVVQTEDENALKARILEAHKILMELSEQNSETFRELVETLENSPD